MTKRQDSEGMEVRTALKHASFDGRDILQIGCGDGRMAFKYAGKARRVVAIDPLRDSIDMAKRGAPKSLAGKLGFETVDEALDDFTRDRKEQYARLDPGTESRIRRILNSMVDENGILTQENVVLTVLPKISPGTT